MMSFDDGMEFVTVPHLTHPQRKWDDMYCSVGIYLRLDNRRQQTILHYNLLNNKRRRHASVQREWESRERMLLTGTGYFEGRCTSWEAWWSKEGLQGQWMWNQTWIYTDQGLYVSSWVGCWMLLTRTASKYRTTKLVFTLQTITFMLNKTERWRSRTRAASRLDHLHQSGMDCI